MSMTDEGARQAQAPSASEKTGNQSAAGNGADEAGTGLPGLAGFSQMQGYAPVAPQAQPAPQQEAVPEPHVPDEAPAQPFTENDDYSGEQAHQQQYSNPIETDAMYAGHDGNGADPLYADGQIHDYLSAGQAPHADALNNGAYDAGAGYDETAYHDGGNSLQAFEPGYEQHPEIPLGAFEDPTEGFGEQPFFHEPGQAGDADFLGGQGAPEEAAPKERRGRKILMASSGLIGVLALGGALAFAYKIGGDSDIASTGKPPLIQADSRPVKMAPDKPGGKEFPHKNKKIYERLGGEKGDEVEKIVPRQEDVAAAATAAIGTSKPAGGAQESQTVNGEPRKVKTLTVRPDGTIEAADTKQKVIKAPAANGVAATTTSDGTIAMSFPQPSSEKTPPPVTPSMPKPVVVTPPPAAPAAQQKLAAAQPPAASAPPPVQKPPVPRAVAPAPAPAASSRVASAAPAAATDGNYVVQVAARKSQTDALAAFADIQQQYPRLLDGYRPIINKADLGNKGVWYRLNVGPVESKKVASALCSQLKSAGMKSCIVRSQ